MATWGTDRRRRSASRRLVAVRRRRFSPPAARALAAHRLRVARREGSRAQPAMKCRVSASASHEPPAHTPSAALGRDGVVVPLDDLAVLDEEDADAVPRLQREIGKMVDTFV